MLSLRASRLGSAGRSQPRKDEVIALAYAAGVDVGSTQAKAVIINEAGEIVGRALLDTGANVIQAAENAYGVAREEAGIDEREIE